MSAGNLRGKEGAFREKKFDFKTCVIVALLETIGTGKAYDHRRLQRN